MTRDEIIGFVQNTFVDYGRKTVSATDVNKSAYVPNMEQKRIFEFFNINPLDRRQNIIIRELFTDRTLTISYYATLRIGANRPPEPRMGLTDLISYIAQGDELLFARDNQNIFIYNLSHETEYEDEENVYAQIDMSLLDNRVNNINPRPNQVEQTVRVYPRNSTLKTYIKRRANYSCEMPNCQYQAFSKNNNEPYLEVHHIIPLSENGEDSKYNTVSLCPNCHRMMHYAINRYELREVLVNYIRSVY